MAAARWGGYSGDGETFVPCDKLLDSVALRTLKTQPMVV